MGNGQQTTYRERRKESPFIITFRELSSSQQRKQSPFIITKEANQNLPPIQIKGKNHAEAKSN